MLLSPFLQILIQTIFVHECFISSWTSWARVLTVLEQYTEQEWTLATQALRGAQWCAHGSDSCCSEMCYRSLSTGKGQESVWAVLVPAGPRLFHSHFWASCSVWRWDRRADSPLQIKEEWQSVYHFLLWSACPNHLVSRTGERGWALTVVQVPNDDIFRPVNAHCSIASLHNLSRSRRVFQLPTSPRCWFSVAGGQSQHPPVQSALEVFSW